MALKNQALFVTLVALVLFQVTYAVDSPKLPASEVFYFADYKKLWFVVEKEELYAELGELTLGDVVYAHTYDMKGGFIVKIMENKPVEKKITLKDLFSDQVLKDHDYDFIAERVGSGGTFIVGRGDDARALERDWVRPYRRLRYGSPTK